MSFPYHQYVEYSNPATPRVYAWEVASATSTSEQDPTLQLPEDPQPSVQQQQQISPSQLQLHQLPPPVALQQQDQHQQPTTPQEHIHHIKQQPHEAHAQQPTPLHQTIQVAPPVKKTPHYRFETVTEADFAQASERPGSSRRRGASKPPSLHVDTSRASPSASARGAAAGGSPSGLPSSGTGPTRIPHSRAHVQSVHPYRRPQSRTTSGEGAGPAAAVRSRRVSEFQSPNTPQTAVGGGEHAAPPTVGTPMSVDCPASHTWREGFFELSTTPPPEIAAMNFDPDAAHRTHILPISIEPTKRYGIRADIYFNAEENVIIAMFELPGVKKSDLHITMSVCPFSRVRQITISGLSRPALPLQGHSVRERKFGQFFRTMVVPPETTSEDIVMSLEDGVLTLSIPCGAPAQAEQPEDIPIP